MSTAEDADRICGYLRTQGDFAELDHRSGRLEQPLRWVPDLTCQEAANLIEELLRQRDILWQKLREANS